MVEMNQIWHPQHSYAPQNLKGRSCKRIKPTSDKPKQEVLGTPVRYLADSVCTPRSRAPWPPLL